MKIYKVSGDLPYTPATSMRRAGLDTARVMKICAWKSVQMFLHYNEVVDEDLDAACKAMEKAEKSA